MKKFINNQIVNQKGYTAPSIDLCTVSVESGYEASAGVVISPWESDNDSLEL
jgi:hypothetical protein